jgi:hypothetical protein
MTPQQLQDGHVRAWKHVYGYGSIVKRLAKARIDLPLAITANLGYRFYAHHLHSHYTCDWPQVRSEAA